MRARSIENKKGRRLSSREIHRLENGKKTEEQSKPSPGSTNKNSGRKKTSKSE